jgi:hypothetical protein
MDERLRDQAPESSPEPAADATADRVLALLGLARRAGRIALGATAVERMVAGGQEPIVIVAQDTSPQQRRRWLALRPVRGFIAEGMERDALARRLGRQNLTVVAVADHGFISGLEALGVVAEPREDSAASNATSGGRR